MLQLPQRLRLNLTDALARHIELRDNLFQRFVYASGRVRRAEKERLETQMQEDAR
jgi:hypothetical protein